MHKESIELNRMNPESLDCGHDDHLERGLYTEEDPIEQEIRAVLRSRYWLLRFPETVNKTV